MRTFCGGRLLPACPHRSGPSPAASSPASSFTHTTVRDAETHSRITAGRRWRVPCFAFPWSFLPVALSPDLNKIVLFHPTCYETHMQTPRGSAARLRLNVASSSTRRNMQTPWRCLQRHKWTTGGEISGNSHVAMFCGFGCSCRFRLHTSSSLLTHAAAPGCHRPLTALCLCASTPLSTTLLCSTRTALEALCSSFTSLTCKITTVVLWASVCVFVVPKWSVLVWSIISPHKIYRGPWC